MHSIGQNNQIARKLMFWHWINCKWKKVFFAWEDIVGSLHLEVIYWFKAVFRVTELSFNCLSKPWHPSVNITAFAFTGITPFPNRTTVLLCPISKMGVEENLNQYSNGSQIWLGSCLKVKNSGKYITTTWHTSKERPHYTEREI